MNTLKHDLTKTEDKRYHCTVCGATWKSKSSTNCPGVHRYEYGEVPKDLLLEWDLAPLNLKLKEGAIRAAVLSVSYYSLYRREDTEFIDSSLPEAITWNERSRRNLKTIGELKKLNKRPKEGVKPTAVARIHDDFKDKYIWIDLYKDEDTEDGVIENKFITKSSLKQNYLLSEGWIKRIGEPDRLVPNPHLRNAAPMQWFSSSRVETFLVENAEEYARWLITRKRKVEIYEENREAIQADAEEWRVRENARRHNRSQEPNLLAFLRDHSEQDKNIIEKQVYSCLSCASGCAFNAGFLCAIYPSGPSNIPCPDYCRRR